MPVQDAPGGAALVLQDPTAARVAETIGRDVAFGLENAAVPRELIWPRVTEALAAARLGYSLDHPTAALSGGEAQRLALAGGLVTRSPVLLLDEPTSMLDAETADAVGAALRENAVRSAATLVVVEHHIEPWLGVADRLIVLGRDGAVVADGEPAAVLAAHGDWLRGQGVWVPGDAAPPPRLIDQSLVTPWDDVPGPLLTAADLGVTLSHRLGPGPRSLTEALAGVDCVVTAGRALAARGRSGAGKSTLMAALAGLITPTTGSVVGAERLATSRGPHPSRWRSRDLAARVSWVPQIPEHGMVAPTVRDEALASGRAVGRDAATAERRADGLLEELGLSHLSAASPHHLSGGEQRRLMVAAALAHGPSAVILDEPTVGQDRLTWASVLGAVASARDAGAGIGIATHDTAAVTALADDVVTLDRGRRVA